MLLGFLHHFCRFTPLALVGSAVVALALPAGAQATTTPPAQGEGAPGMVQPKLTTQAQHPQATPPTPPRRIGMANPASLHCLNAGGRLEIRTGTAGQYGICHLPDGRMCEEWSYFRTGACSAQSLKNL